MAAVPGLAISDRGLSLELERSALNRGERSELGFRITGPDGRAVRDFELAHERRMHMIIVRRDTHGFQHVHPRMDRDGRWSARVKLPEAGSYRVFADFKRGGASQVLGADVAVDGPVDSRPLPRVSGSATTSSGYEVRLSGARSLAGSASELRFGISRGGDTVHPEPYLGGSGHLVALREGDLGYLHTHPEDHGHGGDATGHDDAVAFSTRFPTRGRYRLFLQFKHEGRVHTAEFTREVMR